VIASVYEAGGRISWWEEQYEVLLYRDSTVLQAGSAQTRPSS
jgi:hypothetical protein